MHRLLGCIFKKHKLTKSKNAYPIHSKEGGLILDLVSDKDFDLISTWFSNAQTCRLAFGIDTDQETLTQMALDYLEEMRLEPGGILMISDLSIKSQLPQGFIRYKIFAKRPNRLGRVGILLGEQDVRGKGLGKEAMDTLLHYLFSNQLVDTVELDTAHFNKAAQGCFAKCGFKTIKEIEIVGINSKWVERRIVMQVSSQDWALRDYPKI